MYKIENLAAISELFDRSGEAQFLMALQFLFSRGIDNITTAYLESARKSIQGADKLGAFMTPAYQAELLELIQALSKFPLHDLLLFIKLYVSFRGDDLLQLEEADKALSVWHNIMAPQAWKDAVADPEKHEEILRQMVNRHDTEYTMEEVQAAIRAVAEG